MKAAAGINWRLLFLPMFFAWAGCHDSASTSQGNNQNSHAFAAQGVIEQIAPDLHLVRIHHQTIPGYMIEMTMDFSVHDPEELKGLEPGDEITFTLVVEQDQDWVSDLHRIGHTSVPMTNATSMTGSAVPQLKPGDKLPDVELLAEDGHPIHLSGFHGKVVAFTFFFTRCPLPNFCPLMNRNFSQTRKLLESKPKGPANWQFLSISFDPTFDRPETLSAYADFYRDKNADRWLFASASPTALARLAPCFGLMIMDQEGTIAHNLRTVVIDPQGRLYRQFNDNLWTPPQLAAVMTAAARLPANP